MRRSALVVVIAVAMLGTGCADFGYREFEDVLSGALGVDDADAGDAGVAAARQAMAEAKAEREAQRKLERALRTKNARLLDQAIGERPDDPTYPLYKGALLGAQGDQPGANDAMLQYLRTWNRANPGVGIRETVRRTREGWITAQYRVMLNYPDSSVEHTRMQESYCNWLGLYEQQHGDSPDARPFLEVADWDRCPSLSP